jgi:ribosomal protein S18 acetylase RimI-like enzyme
MNIRPTRSEDIGDMKLILEGTELFPSDMLDDMISGYLSQTSGDELWLSAENGGEVIGFCYAVPEKLTDGTWNMLAIAVLPSSQSRGVGAAIVASLENQLQGMGARVLIADTSGLDDFKRTRDFYRRNNYVEEAQIRDFWAEGNAKVTFWKPLHAA